MLKLRHHQNFTNPRSNTSDKKKAYRDSQQDGLVEVMRGWILLTFGGFFHTTVLIFHILLIIFYGKIVEFIRRRYTHPKIRFVKFREKNPKDALTGVFLFELAVIVIIFTLISISGDVTDYSQW